jgi:ceramide glucosyltransferase
LVCITKEIFIFSLEILGRLIAIASVIYGVLALVSQFKWFGTTSVSLSSDVGVTVLKPMYGATPETYDCLRSFCDQTHPRYQLVFGVADDSDPSIRLIERLRRSFPDRDISLVVDRRQHGTSRKVSNLINLMSHARYEIFVISDSDVRVPRNYLSVVAAPLADSDVGIVTCPYRAVPVRGIWSRIGAMFINEWFMPSVRVAAMFGSRQFAFGASIAIRRDTLEAIGGFQTIADQLADDYRLGQLTRALGKRTQLSPLEVDVLVDDASLLGLAFHEMRWLRTIRAVRPIGYALAFVSLGPPATVIGAMLSGGPWAYVAVATCCLLRVGLHVASREASIAFTDLVLLPVRDVLNLLLWVGSFLTRRVRWRERDYVVQSDGSLLPVEVSATP